MIGEGSWERDVRFRPRRAPQGGWVAAGMNIGSWNAIVHAAMAFFHVRPPLTERSARHKAWAGPPQAETYVTGPNMIRRSRVADQGRQSTRRRWTGAERNHQKQSAHSSKQYVVSGKGNEVDFIVTSIKEGTTK